MDYRNNIFAFSKVSEAQKFINYVEQILSDYHRVTLADLYDYAYKESYDYKANQVVWLEETLTSIENRICPRYDSYKNWWYVKFPEPDQYPASNKVSYKHCECRTTWRNTGKSKKTPTPEPFNVTILMDPTKDPYTTIREVIQQANEIKDRPVFITIN